MAGLPHCRSMPRTARAAYGEPSRRTSSNRARRYARIVRIGGKFTRSLSSNDTHGICPGSLRMAAVLYVFLPPS